MLTANPSKGGDAKLPVYRVYSYDSGVATMPHLSTRLLSGLQAGGFVRITTFLQPPRVRNQVRNAWAHFFPICFTLPGCERRSVWTIAMGKTEWTSFQAAQSAA